MQTEEDLGKKRLALAQRVLDEARLSHAASIREGRGALEIADRRVSLDAAENALREAGRALKEIRARGQLIDHYRGPNH